MDTDVQRTEMDMTGRVAEEIRALLARRRMSGRELARHLGVSPSWVSYRLTGTQPIDLNDLDTIARVLQVEIVDLLPRDRRTPTLTFAIDSPPTVTGVTPHPRNRVVSARLPYEIRRTAPTGR